MKIDLLQWGERLAVVSFVASWVRVILNRLPTLLKIWIAPESQFWIGYKKFVDSTDVILGWISIAVAKFGKSHLLSEEHQDFIKENTPVLPA